jgi:hypothetical protein
VQGGISSRKFGILEPSLKSTVMDRKMLELQRYTRLHTEWGFENTGQTNQYCIHFLGCTNKQKITKMKSIYSGAT